MDHAAIRRLALAASVVASTLFSTAWGQDTGFYIGAGAGQATASEYCDDGDGVVITNCDDADTAFKILAGYRFGRHFALEGAYQGGSTLEGTATALGITGDVETDIQAITFQAVALLPIGERFDLFVKGGAIYWDIDTTGTVAGVRVVDESDSGFDFIAGVGAQVWLLKNLGLRAEVEYAPNVGNSDTGESDVTVVTASVLFRF